MALKSTELRIGNVIFDHKGELKTITAFDLINLECLEKNLHCDPRCKDWRGIPTTGGFLQRLGFICDVLYDDTRPVYVYPEIDFFIDFDTLQPMDSGFDLVSYKVEFIHEIQNICHAATKTELEIKL